MWLFIIVNKKRNNHSNVLLRKEQEGDVMGIDKQKAESDIIFEKMDVGEKGYGELDLAKIIENNTKL